MSKSARFAWGLVFLLFWGCAVTDNKNPRQEDIPKQEIPKEEEGETPSDFEKEIVLEEEKQRFEAEATYREALEAYKALDLERAEYLVRLAIKKDPSHLKARQLLDDIAALKGERQTRWQYLQADLEKQYMIRIQQAKIEINQHIRKGEQLASLGNYLGAIRELEEAQLKLGAIPEVLQVEVKDLVPTVETLLNRLRAQKAEVDRREEEAKKARAMREAEILAEAERKEIKERVRNLLELAYLNFDQRRYKNALLLIDEILSIDPQYKVALELKEDVRRVMHRAELHRYARKKIEGWKKMMDQDKEAMIPYSDLFRFPPREVWQEILKRKPTTFIFDVEAEDPQVKEIKERLKRTMVKGGYSREDTLRGHAEEISRLLGEPPVTVMVDHKLDITVKEQTEAIIIKGDMSVEFLLRSIVERYDLDYHVTPLPAVIITTHEEVLGDQVQDLIEIRDILMRVRDFPAPKMELAPERAEEGLPPIELPEPKPPIPPEELPNIIKKNVEPDIWKPDTGNDIQVVGESQLLVIAPKGVHKKVREFLQRLRTAVGIIISIKARFITAYDDFLQDIGIDISGAPDVSDPGYISPMRAVFGTDYDLGYGEQEKIVGRPGFSALEGTSDIWDIRVQSAGSFANFVVGHTPRLSLVGGLGLQLHFLGDQQLAVVLRAVHKDQRVTLLQEPNLIALNGQRSHLALLTQQAYVAGLKAVTGVETVGVLDPEVDILNVGSTIEVKPIVSNDKKWVTMELTLTQVGFAGFGTIEISTGTAGDEGQQAMGGTLNVPRVTYQRAQTTVQIPDRWTLLISGFKQVGMQDLRSDTPFLSDLPIIGPLFSRRARTEEHHNSIILITPEVIDIGEYEERMR
jgi:tetratricopeptide (TPR) repeat protein